MLFMGEEWGAGTPWQFFTDHTDPEIAEGTRRGRRAEFGSHGWAEEDVPDPQDPDTFRRSRLDWSEPTREPHARLLAWYRDLIRLRRATPDLRDGDLSRLDVRWDQSTGWFVSRRGEHLVLVNLGDQPQRCDAGEVLLAWGDVASAAGGLVVPPRAAAVVRAPL
jgi:maltooligosyltrehalose trehalohydrolase